MKNFRWSQLNIIFLIVFGTAVLCAFVAGISKKIDKPELKFADVENLDSAWIVATQGDYDIATKLPCNLEVDTGSSVSISRYLPDSLPDDYGIAFMSYYNQVEVSVEGDILYQYGFDEDYSFLRAPTPTYNFVAIPKRYAGRVITITQCSDYGIYSGLFAEVYAGSKSALVYEQWKKYGGSVLLSGILFFFMVGLMILSLCLRLAKRLDYRFWYYILFAVISIGYIISGNPILFLYSGHGYFFWILHLLLRMIVPMIYLIFIRGFIHKKRLVAFVDGGILLSGIIYVCLMILHLTGLVNLPASYDLLGWIYEFSFLILTILLLIGEFHYKGSGSKGIVLLNILLVIAGITNHFLRPNHIYQQEGPFWELCVAVFLFLAIGVVLEVVIRQINQQIRDVQSEYENQRTLAITMMNPNFLFSTLNSLLALTKEGSRHSAKYVFAFSKYLRYNLDSIKEDKMIPFETELDHIAAYLELQQMRMPELKVLIEDKMHNFSVPARSIESMVENAVKYGIAKNENRGQVTVRSYERRDCYAIQIVDEGSGFDIDMLYLKETPTSMKTVRERLERGNDAVIEVNSRIGKGTIITVKLPKKKADVNRQRELK